MRQLTVDIPGMQAATGLSRSGIYAEINAGRLETFKIGRRRFTTPDKLEQFIERCAAAQKKPGDDRAEESEITTADPRANARRRQHNGGTRDTRAMTARSGARSIPA